MPRVGLCDAGEGTVLRRVLVWNETGFFLQPDPQHFQNLAEPLEVSGVKPAPTPISKRDGAHVERCAGTTRQSGCDPVQDARWDLYVPRTRPVRRPVHVEGPRVRYAGADAVEHGKVATTCSGPVRHASHRHVPHEPGRRGSIDRLHRRGPQWRRADVQVNAPPGAIQTGAHKVETWSVSQKVVSLSSAEREFAAIGGGTSRGLTVKHVLQEVFDNISLGAKIRNGGENRQRRGQVRVAQSGLRANPPSGHEISLAPRRAKRRVVRS